MNLDEARAFIEQADWVFAKSMPWHPHEYVTRRSSRARGLETEFEQFVTLIERAGYWRIWGRYRWRSINIDDRTYWLYRVWVPVREREIVNRWKLDAGEVSGRQLTLDVD